MKNIFIILLALILIPGCRTTRKTTQSAVKTETNTTTNQSVDSEKAKKVESDLAVVKKTTTKTTKYRPKTTPQKPSVDNSSTIKQEEPERGDIESETTTVIEETLVDKSKIEEVENKKEELKTTEGSKTETVTKQKEVKKAVIKPYMIVLGLLGVVASLIFLFRKSPLISGILAFIKKLFA